MQGDFVRQLQLAKQLEQMAKEAARGREAAETKIAEAAALLAKVKGMDAAAAETERLLTLADQSYKEKEYKEALAYATKSVEASVRARRERLQGMLREASALLERVAPLGRADEATLRAIARATETVDSGDLDRALELSREAWDAAERAANRVLSDAFGRVQSSLLFAEGLELKVEKQRAALRGCREALEAGNVAKTVDLILSLTEALRALALGRFAERAGRAEAAFALGDRFPMEFAEAKERLAKGRELMTSGSVEEAFAALDAAEGAFSSAFSKAVGRRARELRERAERVSWLRKVDLGDLEGRARRLELEESYPEAVAVLEEGREKVRAVEREVLLRRLAALQPRLRLAHMTRRDVSAALRRMEEAREALRRDEPEAAFALVEEASALVEEGLQGYAEVEAELLSVQELRSRCDGLGLACAEGDKLMTSAKRLVLRGEFAQAAEALRGAQRAHRLSLETHFATGIMRLEMQLATAIRLGAEVAAESAALEALTAKVRKGDFELVHGSLVTIAEAVEERTRAAVGERLAEAEAFIARCAPGPGTDRARAALAEARGRLARKEYEGAHALAGELMERLMAERREGLDRSLGEGRELLEMAKRLGADSVILRDKLQRAEELRALGRTDEAAALAEEVRGYGRGIVSSEIDQRLTGIVRRMALARREGVEVGGPERMAEQASGALQHGDLGQAFELALAAKNALDEVVGTHRRLRARLEEGKRVLAEGRRAGVDMAEARGMMERAEALLGAGDLKGATEELDRASVLVRTKAPDLLLEYRLREMTELARLRERLGRKGGEAELAGLGPLDAAHLQGSLEALARLREEWRREVAEALRAALDDRQREVERATARGYSVGPAQQMVLQGRAALDEGRLEEAARVLDVVRTELDEGLQADRRLSEALAALEDAVGQLTELKADARDATALLEQAKALRRGGDVARAEEHARRGLERADGIAALLVGQLAAFAGGLTPEREEWEDLRPARKLHEDMEAALRARRYRHAHLLARSFREELERTLQDKAQAEDAVREFEARLEEEAKAGLRPPALERTLERAKALLAQGRFVQAMGTVAAAGDELRALSEMYEARLKEYNELREALNSLEVLDARKDHIEGLLEQGLSSLRELRFDSASLFLRRARTALNEFLATRTNELLWEFTPLHDLMKRFKAQRRFAAEVAEIERTTVDGIDPRALNRLSRNVELVRAGLGDIFQEQREKARRAIERAARAGKEAGRAWEVWAEAEAQAGKGDLWGAFTSLEAAVNAIGRKAGEAPEQLSKQVAEVLERAGRERVRLPETERAYAEALQAGRDGGADAELLRRALETSRNEVRATCPRIAVDAELAGDAKEGRPMDVLLRVTNTGEHAARAVRAFLFGDAEVRGMLEAEALAPGESAEGRITVIPNRVGILSLGISVKCRPLLTDEDILYDSKLDLDVK